VLDVPVGPDLLPRHPPSVDARPAPQVVTVDGGDGPAVFRLPDTADLRAVAQGAGDPEAGRWLLLERLLVSPPGNGPVSDATAEAAEAAMEATSPGAAVLVTVACPDCGARTEAALDVAVLLWSQVEAAAVALLGDIHTLASAYGWTEADVLALSPGRRLAYLELVNG
jgi:hypothetical protein